MKHITEIKSKNKKDIIKLLYKKNIMSKKRIAAELELSPSVITKLCSELIKENILVEMNRIDSKKLGRKEVEIKINPN
ncbi:winged helix-turn-helix transcriptional regulator [Brachyspira hampsonii]|nr:winged helix-turn-helix transcriptional regulator [Brachyspira hampsonii]